MERHVDKVLADAAKKMAQRDKAADKLSELNGEIQALAQEYGLTSVGKNSRQWGFTAVMLRNVLREKGLLQ